MIKNLITKEKISKSDLTFLSDMDDFFETLEKNTEEAYKGFIEQLHDAFRTDVVREFKTHILEIFIIMFGDDKGDKYLKHCDDFFMDQFHPSYIRKYNQGIELDKDKEYKKETVINIVREKCKIDDLFSLIYHVLFTDIVKDYKED